MEKLTFNPANPLESLGMSGTKCNDLESQVPLTHNNFPSPPLVIPKRMPWEILADMPIPQRDAIIKALELYGRSRVGWDDFAVSLGTDVRGWLSAYLKELYRNGFMGPTVYIDKEGRKKIQVLQLREVPSWSIQEKGNWLVAFGGY